MVQNGYTLGNLLSRIVPSGEVTLLGKGSLHLIPCQTRPHLPDRLLTADTASAFASNFPSNRGNRQFDPFRPIGRGTEYQSLYLAIPTGTPNSLIRHTRSGTPHNLAGFQHGIQRLGACTTASPIRYTLSIHSLCSSKPVAVENAP
jgi:hypothetical protein